MTTSDNFYNTPEEQLWSGEFGNEFIQRICKHTKEKQLQYNACYNVMLKKTNNIKSIFEVGPCIGLSAKALQNNIKSAKYHSIDINKLAVKHMRSKGFKCELGSINTYMTDKKYDIVVTKGVLVHINQSKYKEVIIKLSSMSKKYVLITEYFSHSPQTINYRGTPLHKRDFGEDFISYCNLNLVDYGFFHKNDPVYRQLNMNCFLFKIM